MDSESRNEVSSRERFAVNVADALLGYLHLFIAMYASELLIKTPVYGGALYAAGRYFGGIAKSRGRVLGGVQTPAARVRNTAMVASAAAFSLALVGLYPFATDRTECPQLVFAVALLLMRQHVTDRYARRLAASQRWAVLKLLLLHTAFIAFGMAMFHESVNTRETSAVFVGVGITGVSLLLRQLRLHPSDDPGIAQPPSEADDIMNVSSYRTYSGMVVSSLVAANLCAVSFICCLRYMPYTSFTRSLFDLLVWLTFVLAVTAGLAARLRRSEEGLERPALFIAGAALLISSAALAYRGSHNFTGYRLYLLGAMFGVGLACLLSMLSAMGVNVKAVVEIGAGKSAAQAYEKSAFVLLERSSQISWLLVLGALTLASFLMDGQYATLPLPPALRWLSLLLPLPFALAAVQLIIVQPLTRPYIEKLRDYQRLLASGELNRALEERLHRVLVAGYPKRVGINVVKFVFRVCIPLKIEGRQFVDASEKPVVFVCNHYEIFGPIAAVVRIPYFLRPWIIHELLSREIITDGLRSGVDTVFHWMPAFLRRFLSRKLAPFVLWVLQSLEPIPVYRSNSREVISTMQQTVNALECRDNILIFPENPASDGEDRYASEGVSSFFTGFSAIGQMYFHKTGKQVTFIPIFISKKRRVLAFGEGVVFNPNAPRAEEKERIVTELHRRMNEMASAE